MTKLLFLILGVLLLLAGQGSALAVRVSNDYELYAALQDQNSHMVLVDRSIRVHPSAWPGMVVVGRNITIMASPECTHAPLVDFVYVNGQIQLGPGVHLNLEGLMLAGQTFRSYTPLSAPGLCVLAPSQLQPTEAARPRVTIKRAGVIYTQCPPFNTVRRCA